MAAPPRGDTTYTKIFVGGLPYHTTDESLKAYFDAFGAIEEAVVITDRQTGKSRGYGFVTMADKEGAEKACKDPNPVIDGRKANVNLAFLGAKPRGVQPMYPSPFQLATKGQAPVVFPQMSLQHMFYPQVLSQQATAAGGGGLVVSPATSPISAPAASINPYAALDYNTAAYLQAAQYPTAAAAAFEYPGSAASASYALAAAQYPYGLPQTGLPSALSAAQFQAAQQN